MQIKPPHTPAPAPVRLVAERLSDRLAEHLAYRIESADLLPGDRLPTEQQLALAHGVSRTVVREAVHQLKSRGMLRSRQGSGVFVSAPPLARDLSFDVSVLDSMDAVVQVREVRRALEGETAALAARRASSAQIATLRRALRAVDRSTADGGDGVEEDLAFHRAIAEATGNPQFTLLLAFLEQYLREAMRVTRGNEARRADFMQQVRAEHLAIVDAIATHDLAAARRCAVRHLLRGERRLHQGGAIDTAKAAAPRPSARRKGG